VRCWWATRIDGTAMVIDTGIPSPVECRTARPDLTTR